MAGEVAARWSVWVRGARRAAEVPVVAWWSAAVPVEVQLEVYDGGQPLVWSVARDVLAAGRFLPAGTPGGDVAVRPGFSRGSVADVVEVVLSVDGVGAVLVVRDADLAEFLARTSAVVPFGAEQVAVPDFVPAGWTRESAP